MGSNATPFLSLLEDQDRLFADGGIALQGEMLPVLEEDRAEGAFEVERLLFDALQVARLGAGLQGQAFIEDEVGPGRRGERALHRLGEAQLSRAAPERRQ